MYLNPVEIELLLLFQNNYLYPKNREDFFKAIEKLDSNRLYIEKVLSKSDKIYYNIADYFKDYSDENIQNVIDHIL